MNDQDSDSGVTAGVVITFVLVLLCVGMAALGGAGIYFVRAAAYQAAAAEQRAHAAAQAERAAANRTRASNAIVPADQGEPKSP